MNPEDDPDFVEFDFDDPVNFPQINEIMSVIMIDDGSLEIQGQGGLGEYARASIVCPSNTKMHAHVLSITGPLESGGSWFYLEHQDLSTYYD